MATGRVARGPSRPGLKIQARGPYGPKRAENFFIEESSVQRKIQNFVNFLQILLKISKISKFFLKVCQKLQ